MFRSARSQSWTLSRAFLAAWGTLAILGGAPENIQAHSGLVDGYGCHRGPDKVTYHCHEGQFMGRTFKSREDFLRQLRGGKSPDLTPRGNPTRPAPPQKKFED